MENTRLNEDVKKTDLLTKIKYVWAVLIIHIFTVIFTVSHYNNNFWIMVTSGIYVCILMILLSKRLYDAEMKVK